MTISTNAHIDETAIVEPGAEIGDGTKIWHHCHIRAGARIGKDTTLGKNVYVDDGAVVGNRCKIQNNVSLYNGVTLEDSVFIGPSAVFTNDLNPRAAGEHWLIAPTLVRQGASIGANATIVCGVTIGEWAMVGAGAVVVADVIPHELVVGNPAHRLGWVCLCGQILERGRQPFSGSDCAVCGRSVRPRT